MKIDLTVLPAKVTITNVNVKPVEVGEENNGVIEHCRPEILRHVS